MLSPHISAVSDAGEDSRPGFRCHWSSASGLCNQPDSLICTSHSSQHFFQTQFAMGYADKMKSQTVLRTEQQGILCYSTYLLTEKLICRRLPSPPAKQEINFVWALLRSGFQVHSYIPSTKEAEEFELRQCSPSQDPVMPGDLQIQNTDSANPRKVML